MELSDPASSDHSDNAATRRKSGRVIKKPEILAATDFGLNNSKSKRKRAQQPGDDENEVEDEDASEDDSSESEDSDVDEEEIKEKKRKAARARKTQSKPVAKRPRTANASQKTLAMRPAINGTRKPRKPRGQAAAAAEAIGGLYAEVFATGQSVDAVAAQWLNSYEAHNAIAMTDLINFVLRCTGCDLEVTIHDIEDPDNVTGRLADLQDEYQAQKITEYPLISKARGHAPFRATLMGFFVSLVATMDATSALYDDLALIENIQVWVTTMSSSAIRPFRHTATVISLAIVSALCDVGRAIEETSAKTLRQQEGEKKKARVNKARVASLQAKIDEGARKRETVDATIRDIFDTVFVHRYRDVDPKIRADCMQALGHWILAFPDFFFEGQYLRYMGWVLSDTSAPTRLEVVKQLQKLFKNKDNIAGLRTFTERFRPRLVEMAARDADPACRSSTVELLDTLREAGLLEPDDIDVVGRLLFDSEARVRKAVVGFFAENINDLFQAKLEEVGGEEALDEALAREGEEDFDSPRISWLKLKCLVEVLQSYDSEDREELPSQIQRGAHGTSDILVASGVESRFSLAAQALYDKIPEVREWEVLAGYLLFDHSSTTENASADDPEMALRIECKLDEKEETILLEVLNEAVKLRLTSGGEQEVGKKKTKARKQESLEIQETAARHLAQMIPRLLNKFGAVPQAASVVLRLEHVLNLDVFEELRQDSTAYSDLLDDINKQFLTHADQNVLVEASAALLHAKSFEELEEVTEGKVQLLWEDTMGVLQGFSRRKDLSIRGNFNLGDATELANNLRRINNLAKISDCIETFEAVPSAASNNKRKKNDTSPSDAFTILVQITKRGTSDDLTGNEAEIEDVEDMLVSMAQRCLIVYFMWKARSLQSLLASGKPIPERDLNDLQERREAFVAALRPILEKRTGGMDQLRLSTVDTLLDIYTLFSTFRQARPKPSQQPEEADQAGNLHVQDLVKEIPPDLQTTITSIFAAVEKTYAKKSHRVLEAGDEDEPADDESDAEDSDDDDDGVDEHERQRDMLEAERALCQLSGKLVFAIIAKVIDSSPPLKGQLKERLARNRGRLGHSFKEIIAYLDEPKAKKPSTRVRAKAKATAAADGGRSHKSKEIVVEDDSDEDEDEDIGDAIRVTSAASASEGGEEDLAARELIVDADMDDEDEGGDHDEEAEEKDENAAAARNADDEDADDEDDVMGD
ncbi:MAG: hypothetical protein M1819_006980 [Sarea resinae]|nr:MAG: hypothetical protein M1819_006980 [Sarea resinae]